MISFLKVRKTQRFCDDKILTVKKTKTGCEGWQKNIWIQAALVIRGGYVLGKSLEYQNRG